MAKTYIPSKSQRIFFTHSKYLRIFSYDIPSTLFALTIKPLGKFAIGKTGKSVSTYGNENFFPFVHKIDHDIFCSISTEPFLFYENIFGKGKVRYRTNPPLCFHCICVNFSDSYEDFSSSTSL